MRTECTLDIIGVLADGAQFWTNCFKPTTFVELFVVSERCCDICCAEILLALETAWFLMFIAALWWDLLILICWGVTVAGTSLMSFWFGPTVGMRDETPIILAAGAGVANAVENSWPVIERLMIEAGELFCCM